MQHACPARCCAHFSVCLAEARISAKEAYVSDNSGKVWQARERMLARVVADALQRELAAPPPSAEPAAVLSRALRLAADAAALAGAMPKLDDYTALRARCAARPHVHSPRKKTLDVGRSLRVGRADRRHARAGRLHRAARTVRRMPTVPTALDARP